MSNDTDTPSQEARDLLADEFKSQITNQLPNAIRHGEPLTIGQSWVWGALRAIDKALTVSEPVEDIDEAFGAMLTRTGYAEPVEPQAHGDAGVEELVRQLKAKRRCPPWTGQSDPLAQQAATALTSQAQRIRRCEEALEAALALQRGAGRVEPASDQDAVLDAEYDAGIRAAVRTIRSILQDKK